MERTTETTDPTGTLNHPCKGCRDEAPWGAMIDGIASANRVAAAAVRDVQRLHFAILFAVVVVVGLYVKAGRS
jgi:hypothetical protein